MKKVRCALIGSGNIGTDLIYKIKRSPVLELGDGNRELLGDGLAHGLCPGRVGVAHGDVDEHGVGRGRGGDLTGHVTTHPDGLRHGRQNSGCREQLCVRLHPLLGEGAALKECATIAGPGRRHEELGARLVDLFGGQRGRRGEADADEDDGNDDPPPLPNHLQVVLQFHGSPRVDRHGCLGRRRPDRRPTLRNGSPSGTSRRCAAPSTGSLLSRGRPEDDIARTRLCPTGALCVMLTPMDHRRALPLIALGTLLAVD